MNINGLEKYDYTYYELVKGLYYSHFLDFKDNKISFKTNDIDINDIPLLGYCKIIFGIKNYDLNNLEFLQLPIKINTCELEFYYFIYDLRERLEIYLGIRSKSTYMMHNKRTFYYFSSINNKYAISDSAISAIRGKKTTSGVYGFSSPAKVVFNGVDVFDRKDFYIYLSISPYSKRIRLKYLDVVHWREGTGLFCYCTTGYHIYNQYNANRSFFPSQSALYNKYKSITQLEFRKYFNNSNIMFVNEYSGVDSNGNGYLYYARERMSAKDFFFHKKRKFKKCCLHQPLKLKGE